MPADLLDWTSESISDIIAKPFRGSLHAAYTTYLGLWYTISTRRELGTNVLDLEWDILVVLDGCRVDALNEVKSEYSFLNSIGTLLSVGSHSREWIAKTFTKGYTDELSNTALITGNAHIQSILSDRDFPPKETVPFCYPAWKVARKSDLQYVEELWRYEHWDEVGVPPRPVTDRSIAIWREIEPDRLIAHYMQPHTPYIGRALAENRDLREEEIEGWKLLESRDITSEEHWDLYLDNLRCVLDDVELLLNNTDAEQVCITADHGNVYGELGAFGHPEGFLHPKVKRVPWAETSGTDDGKYSPEYVPPEAQERTVEETLEGLGYL